MCLQFTVLKTLQFFALKYFSKLCVVVRMLFQPARPVLSREATGIIICPDRQSSMRDCSAEFV